MMARSTGSTLRPNTVMQLSRSSVRQHHLATHGRTIHHGTDRTAALIEDTVAIIGAALIVGAIP
jgi:uncharacterized membrane protein